MLSVSFVQSIPLPEVQATVDAKLQAPLVRRVGAWLMWLPFLGGISLPGVLRTIYRSMPENNTLYTADSRWIFALGERLAAALKVLLDMLVVPKIVDAFARRSGIKPGMLLASVAVAATWLVVAALTIVLNDGCCRYWVLFWKACYPEYPDFDQFYFKHGDVVLLDPSVDLCMPRPRFWEVFNVCLFVICFFCLLVCLPVCLFVCLFVCLLIFRRRSALALF